MNASTAQLEGNLPDIRFDQSAAVKQAPEGYALINIDIERVLASWQGSLFVHEWLDKSGKVKEDKELGEIRLKKRFVVRGALAKGDFIERPVLGIGMFDNVEIGSGADVLTTLYLEGLKVMGVYVRVGQRDEFAAFID